MLSSVRLTSSGLCQGRLGHTGLMEGYLQFFTPMEGWMFANSTLQTDVADVCLVVTLVAYSSLYRLFNVYQSQDNTQAC